MKYPDDICKLVIENLNIAENIPQIVSNIEENLFYSIRERIRRTKETQWNEIIINEKGDYSRILSFYPECWMCHNENKPKASYAVGWLPTPGGVAFNWISHAIGLDGSSLCIYFYLDHNYFNLKAKVYKQKLNDFFSKSLLLKANDFRLNDISSSILIPFHFSQEIFSNDYPRLNNSLEPLDDALDKLLSVHEEFDKFVNSIKVD